ncbi:leucine-rich repeat domain-containing protein [Butyricimonas paravirosa]|uniref:Uncharacterized protein (DUF2344 family) n=1 Tax=Butyricimonas paravirosa TaxID=1472417 RepID=A0A7X5YER8_9BACT|nr:leucine-rich repeat domain-containing protein [Butyricimonas paravirosa]NJC19777.1 uncharacterized protein (DUF2344 family) [Butyricimonas paravirosa]WOF13725.1 hypothetical protein F1644_16290 [Butyricimonas paravirosa]GGJ71553.1 hypothetical protein GCM10007042_33220 [Butyricimonas paravirosa]
MKKIYLLMMLLATVFVACSDDDEKDNGTPWEIKMTIEVEENGTQFSASLTDKNGKTIATETIVDWGNGDTDANREYLEHYYNAGTYSITIKGKGEIGLNITNQNIITALDVTKCPTLVHLSCNSNQLTSLDISKCTKLYRLECNDNQLTSLEVSKCIELNYLDCCSNNLTSLNASKCQKLIDLRCHNNQLTLLNINECTKLVRLYCDNNQLVSLDITACSNLHNLVCGDNHFNDDAMNSIYNNLPSKSGKDKGTITLYKDNAKGDITIAQNKYWTVNVE